MTPANYEAQLHRLRQARQGADVVVDTTDMTAEEVYSAVKSRLSGQDGQEPRLPVPDEPGSDMEAEHQPPLPVPDEPGESPGGRRYDDLPIPEER